MEQMSAQNGQAFSDVARREKEELWEAASAVETSGRRAEQREAMNKQNKDPPSHTEGGAPSGSDHDE